MDKAQEVKQCPFCGGKAKLISQYDSDDNRPDGEQYSIMCECGARGAEFYAVTTDEIHLTKDQCKSQKLCILEAQKQALESWNTRLTPPTDEGLRNLLAEAEHEQWMRWAKNLMPELKQLVQHHLPYGREEEAGNCHCKTCERIKRWEKLFIPYDQLTVEQKDQDRKEADIILAILADSKQGESEPICPKCGNPNCDGNGHYIESILAPETRLHDILDEVNAKYGNEKELCLFCHSIIADNRGIAHQLDCPVLELRLKTSALVRAECQVEMANLKAENQALANALARESARIVELQATHKKEVESIFQEFGTLVDLSKLPFILDVINSIKSKHLKASELRG